LSASDWLYLQLFLPNDELSNFFGRHPNTFGHSPKWQSWWIKKRAPGVSAAASSGGSADAGTSCWESWREPQRWETVARDDSDAGLTPAAAGNAPAPGVFAGTPGTPSPSCTPAVVDSAGGSVEPPSALALGVSVADSVEPPPAPSGETQQRETEAPDDGDAGRASAAACNAPALGFIAGAPGRPSPSCAPAVGDSAGASVEPPLALAPGVSVGANV